MSNLEVQLFLSKTGNTIAEVNGYLIHSKYDPVKDAKRIADKEYKENYIHVLFGYGMGYLADALQAKMKGEEQLIIVEPFKQFLNSENQDVIYIEDKSKILNRIKNALHDNSREVKVICSYNYDKLAPKEYLGLLKDIKDVQRINQVEENTVRFASGFWQENYIKNIFYAIQDVPITKLEKVYNCPIVIASGGPSLTKQLPLLKKVRKNIILIASGSTVNSLIKEGIDPDYIVTIDGADANYKHFKELNTKTATLLYCMSSNYKIQQEYKRNRLPFLYLKDYSYKKYLKNHFNVDLPMLAGGGSVAHFAFVIAMFITNGPIALIGQDLAYTENLTHASNNKNKKVVDDSFYKKRDAFEVEGYFGEKVMTDYALFSMKKTFEELKSLYKHLAPIYNCTEGGAKIEGFNQIPFQQFINDYICKEEVLKVEIEQSTNKELVGKLFEKFNSEIELYSKLEKLLNDAIYALKLEKNNLNFSNGLLKKLQKIDDKTNCLFKEVLMEDIVKPLTMDVMRNYKEKVNETPKERFNRIYNQNMTLYSQLLEVTKNTKQFTIEAIETINNEMGGLV